MIVFEYQASALMMGMMKVNIKINANRKHQINKEIRQINTMK